MKIKDNSISNSNHIDIFDFNISLEGLQSLMKKRVEPTEAGSIAVTNCTTIDCKSVHCSTTQCTTVQCNVVQCVQVNCSTGDCTTIECLSYTSHNDCGNPVASVQCRDCTQCAVHQCYSENCYYDVYADDCKDDGD